LIEHVRFGVLMDRLSKPAQGKLMRLAAKTGLEKFLLDGVDAPTLPPEGPRLSARDRRAAKALAIHNAFISDAVQALRTTPDLTTGARLAAVPPPKDKLAITCLVLTEIACRRGVSDFETLVKTAKAQGMQQMPARASVWETSALLPWRWVEGTADALPGMIEALAKNDAQWIMTPPLAWVMCRLAQTPEGPHTAATVEAFINFLKSQNHYWGRVPCVALTGAMADLVATAHSFAPDLTTKIENAAIQTYGLMPGFWEALGTRGSERMAMACAHFAALEPGAEAAWAYFEAAGASDLSRFGRDLQAPLRRDDAALRKLAHPLTPESAAQDTPLSEAARRVMPQLYNETPVSGLARELRAASLASAAVLEGGNPDALTFALAPLGTFGQTLGLTVLAGLIDRGDTVGAQALWDTLDLPPTLPKTPATDHAQLQLRRRSGHPLADAALRHISGMPPALPASDALHDGASPIHDTLITVFSCQAHLETRIPQMRRGWLRDLDAMGLQYVIIVGGGTEPEGVLDGDVLTLPCDDDYEGLPDKTLATLRWVHDRTAFAHMFKVDDDCLLNVDALFHGLGVLRHDYYGRPLIRVPGQMDRGWHVTKSTSPRGRLELDKSPEPSLYADGGSGYALSRRAMAATLHALETPKGRALVQSSFMEDKLLGDLLALQGIRVSGEDYLITVRRRGTPGGIPVPRWVNGFDASQTAPVSLVHLDDPEVQEAAYARLQTPALRPAKIWPSYQDAALGPHSNALELISDCRALDAAQDADVAVVACVRNEMFMLPHFLRHYRALGVTSFLIADNCSDDGTLEYLAEQPDVALFSVDTDYGRSHYGVAWQQALISAFRVGKWSLMADADEFLVWQQPQEQALPALLATPEFSAADAVRIFMLDMYPQGPLINATFASGDPFGEAGFSDVHPFRTDAPGAGPFSDAETFTSALRHRLIPGSRPELFVAQKLALLRYRPWMRLTAGLHYVGGVKPAARDLIFAHFKYNADFRRKAQAEVARGQHFNDAEEYRKYLALVSEGRDVIFDADLSVPWTDSDFARRILQHQAL